jgi:hypothetical protein
MAITYLNPEEFTVYHDDTVKLNTAYIKNVPKPMKNFHKNHKNFPSSKIFWENFPFFWETV